MNVIEMKLAGTIKTGDYMPETFATIRRLPHEDQIQVTLITCNGEKKHFVNADCEEDICSMAECLQYHLDGCQGTNSMIHDYYRILENFTD